MTNPIYPLTFKPAFKDYIWGGRNLETVLGKSIPDGTVAEIWEISGHPHGLSTVADGPLAGQDLLAVQEKLGEDLVGANNRYALDLGKFPVLIKLLDANRWLSVQVHPEDEYALEHEGDFGKTEMWVILHAEPGAEIIFGFKPGVDRAAFAQAVADGRSEDLLHRVPTQAGDVFFVAAGSVHALGPGIIVAEIQQNSDTTYRIYDWGRVGHDGQPRPLHIEKGLAVMNFAQVEPGPLRPRVVVDMLEQGDVKVEEIGHCRYFHTERITMPAESALVGECDGSTYEIFAVLSGQATVYWDGEPVKGDPVTADAVTVKAVNWVLLPAALGEYQIQADADSVILRVVTPEG